MTPVASAQSPTPCAATAAAPCVEASRVVAHRQIAAGIFRIRLECPAIARQAVPGQFAMLRIDGRVDPLLARPLAVYDTFAAADDTIPRGLPAERRYADFVYAVHGRFTTALQEIPPGALLSLCGPLGNGFLDVPRVPHLLLVAGGIGQTALLSLGRERAAAGDRVTFCWGAGRSEALGDIDDFRHAGMDVHVATLDGSAGVRGTVIDLLESRFPSATGGEPEIPVNPLHVACCGPDRMMAAVGTWASARGLGCHVSLEAPMACGIGICFTCVARVRDAAGGWDYRRTCVEGPVFKATDIVWD
ncbi:MAG: dihydroorotate dehydrogenase electron transfer subunit [Planctomycetota bacterium]|nr:MAG: dihydroorotate dehydrogenase electron transfer subunit [Planctomycetota bacterium]